MPTMGLDTTQDGRVDTLMKGPLGVDVNNDSRIDVIINPERLRSIIQAEARAEIAARDALVPAPTMAVIPPMSLAHIARGSGTPPFPPQVLPSPRASSPMFAGWLPPVYLPPVQAPPVPAMPPIVAMPVPLVAPVAPPPPVQVVEKIVEVEKPIYVERPPPSVQVVEKIVEVEKPIYVERPAPPAQVVERIVEVEKPIYVERERRPPHDYAYDRYVDRSMDHLRYELPVYQALPQHRVPSSLPMMSMGPMRRPMVTESWRQEPPTTMRPPDSDFPYHNPDPKVGCNFIGHELEASNEPDPWKAFLERFA